MFNNTGVKREVYGNRNQILFAIEHQVSMGIVVGDTGVTATNGKKIVKAGTPMYGNIDDRTKPFVISNTVPEGQTAPALAGILLHDVDVTLGENNGTLLLFGFVNVNRLDTDVQSKITASVKSGLPMIKMVKC